MKLKKISLAKAVEHECPTIKVGNRFQYLAVLKNGRMAVGHFSREWYGLNFDGFYDAGLQFNAPGWNASSWKELYLIVR